MSAGQIRGHGYDHMTVDMFVDMFVDRAADMTVVKTVRTAV